MSFLSKRPSLISWSCTFSRYKSKCSLRLTKLCRLIPVNAGTFSHTPQHPQKAGNFPSSTGCMEALSKEFQVQKTGHTLEKNNYTPLIVHRSWSVSVILILTISEERMGAIHCDVSHNSETVSIPIQKMSQCQPVVNSVLMDTWRSGVQIPCRSTNFMYLSCGQPKSCCWG